MANKTFKHNPTARINNNTGKIDLTVGGQTFDLDPEQATFIGEILRDFGGRAKAAFPVNGFTPVPDEDDHTPQDIDALEAQDGIGDGSWAIPKGA